MDNSREKTPVMSVYDYIYDEIMHRRLKPGQVLTENYICGCMNVGRSTVRLALQQLAKDGFVELRANRSAIVTQFTQSQLRQLYSLRELFLEYALGQTITFYEEEDFTLLENCLSDMEKAFDGRNFGDYTAAVTKFYRAIIDKADNQYLSQCAVVVINRINVYTCLYDMFYSVKRLKTLSLQNRMVQGIREGKLSNVLRAHKKLSNEVVVAYNQVAQSDSQKI